MAVYKDKNRGTWYASFLYEDWTGKRCRKLKRGFSSKKEAQEWEMHFRLQKANSLDMTFRCMVKAVKWQLIRWKIISVRLQGIPQRMH